MTDTTPTPQDRLQIATDDGDPVVLTLTGDLDPHTSPHLQAVIDDVVGDDPRTVVLDVGGVAFVDSAGLRVFADTHRSLASSGATLVVRNPTSGLEKLLSVTGLADHLSIER